MANATGKVIVGFILQLILYCAYIFAGAAIIAIPSTSGPQPRHCLLNLKIYSGVGIVIILRTLITLCIAFGRYLRQQPTFPSPHEIMIRVMLKAFLALYGIILYSIYNKPCFPALRATNNDLWVFYSITAWSNVISAIVSILTLKSSLQSATRLNETRLNHATSRGINLSRGSSFGSDYMVESTPLSPPPQGLSDKEWDPRLTEEGGRNSVGNDYDENSGTRGKGGGGRWSNVSAPASTRNQRDETDAGFQDAMSEYSSPSSRSPRLTARLA